MVRYNPESGIERSIRLEREKSARQWWVNKYGPIGNEFFDYVRESPRSSAKEESRRNFALAVFNAIKGGDEASGVNAVVALLEATEEESRKAVEQRKRMFD